MDLGRRQKLLAESGVAENTRKTRRQQLKRYRKFCRSFKLKDFPCTASQASLYATYLSDKLKPISIRNYLSAVWYFQKFKGHPDFSSDFMLKLTLDGIERAANATVTVRYPLSPEDMHSIYSHLDMNVNVDRIFWCSIVVAFRGILRCCHVTNSIHSLKIKDVSITKDFVKIHIRTSKTDQFGRKPYDVFLQRFDGSPLCPALILLDLITVSGANPNSRVFSRRGHTQEYSYVNSRLKALAALVNLPLQRVSTHSLRHGGATFLKNLGMSVKDIMKRANWKSNAVYRYLHDSGEQLLSMDVLPSQFLSLTKN